MASGCTSRYQTMRSGSDTGTAYPFLVKESLLITEVLLVIIFIIAPNRYG